MPSSYRLGAINLTHYNHLDNNGLSYAIIDTPKFSQDLKYLLDITYLSANKNSPEFITKYNSTEQKIVVNFSTLNLILHQEGLQNLLSISDSMIRKLTDLQNKSLKVNEKDRIATADQRNLIEQISTLAVIEEEDDSDEAIEKTEQSKTESRRQKHKRAAVVESIKIHLIANLEQVGVLLTCRARPIASLKIQHFDAGVILKSSYTELNVRLRNILITDLNRETIHSKVNYIQKIYFILNYSRPIAISIERT